MTESRRDVKCNRVTSDPGPGAATRTRRLANEQRVFQSDRRIVLVRHMEGLR
jgi:hypothetical protein